MSTQGSLTLTVAATAENLAVIRQALAGFAAGLGFDDDAIADLKTVASEACMNAVVHAYGDEPGPLEIHARPHEDGMKLNVRDEGAGFQPRPVNPDEPGLRLGLPLIAALSESFEIHGGPGRGTEVRITVSSKIEKNHGGEVVVESKPTKARGTVMTIRDGDLLRIVLSRVISALAARADFSVDRLSDTLLLGDALSVHDSTDFAADALEVEIWDGDGTLDLRIGPLVQGAGDRMLSQFELPGGGSLRKLANEVSVEKSSDEPAEYLRMNVAT